MKENVVPISESSVLSLKPSKLSVLIEIGDVP